MDGRQLLADWIGAAKLTQAKVAADIGCSEGHLSLVLARRRGVSLRLAKRIADLTGGTVPMETLVLDDDDEEAA